MPNHLTSADVVAWLRSQAEKFGKMADEIETTFNQAKSSRTQNFVKGNKQVKKEDVIQILRERQMRRPEIAVALDISDDALDLILKKDQGFQRNDRGWWTYQPEE